MLSLRIIVATVITLLIASSYIHLAALSPSSSSMASSAATPSTSSTSEVKSVEAAKSRVIIVGAAGGLGRAVVQSSLRAGLTTSVRMNVDTSRKQ